MDVKEVSMHGEPIRPVRNFFMRTIPLLLYTPIFFIIVFLKRIFVKNNHDFKHKVSLCLIFKDEGPYLKEWIEYHRLIGVDHFYLYNNFSTDNYQEILKPYIEQGIVTLIDFPYQYAQIKAYNDCYNLTKNETEWIGFIDADEYINLIKHDNIKDFLNEYRNYPSLYLNWLMFGTSGIECENFNELTIERYTQSWDFLCATGKTLINNNFKNHTLSVHSHKCQLWGFPLFSVSPIKSVSVRMHTLFTKGISNIAFLNHYWSRSYEFYRFKDFVKGDVASEKHIQLKQKKGRFERYELRNKTKNFSIQRWLILLKESIKNSI